jgi:hypothetical protein
MIVLSESYVVDCNSEKTVSGITLYIIKLMTSNAQSIMLHCYSKEDRARWCEAILQSSGHKNIHDYYEILV